MKESKENERYPQKRGKRGTNEAGKISLAERRAGSRIEMLWPSTGPYRWRSLGGGRAMTGAGTAV